MMEIVENIRKDIMNGPDDRDSRVSLINENSNIPNIEPLELNNTNPTLLYLVRNLSMEKVL